MVLCKEPNENCYLQTCPDCPGTENLVGYLQEIFEKHEVLQVSYKAWNTDQQNKTSLLSLMQNTEDFLPVLSKQFEKLLPHAFIAEQ